MYIHIVARSVRGVRPFNDPRSAWMAFRRLRQAWPAALAACVMPDHIHVVVEASDVALERDRVVRTLAGLSRTLDQAGIWERSPEAEVIPDLQHLRRVVRYVHLNPNRSRLAVDPLSWPWSTHRGVVGAEIDPWVTAGRLALALCREQSGFRQWFHAYVSGDPSVAPNGTPFPEPAAAVEIATVPLDRVIRAALSATPWSDSAMRRQVASLLAHEQGWVRAPGLRDALGLTQRSIRRHRAKTLDLSAARLCLGDARLCFTPEQAAGIEGGIRRDVRKADARCGSRRRSAGNVRKADARGASEGETAV